MALFRNILRRVVPPEEGNASTSKGGSGRGKLVKRGGFSSNRVMTNDGSGDNRGINRANSGERQVISRILRRVVPLVEGTETTSRDGSGDNIQIKTENNEVMSYDGCGDNGVENEANSGDKENVDNVSEDYEYEDMKEDGNNVFEDYQVMHVNNFENNEGGNGNSFGDFNNGDIDGPENNRDVPSFNSGGEGGMSWDRTKLIVNYVPQLTTDQELMVLFQTVGDVEHVKVVRHPQTGYGFGYGFVKFRQEIDAARAIEIFNGFHYREKTLKVSYARPQYARNRNTNLFVSSLPRGFTEENLINLFSKYGEIIQRNLLRCKITGRPKGVAFVRYSRADEAEAAINALNGVRIANSFKPLEIKIAESPNRHRQQLIERDINNGTFRPSFQRHRNYVPRTLGPMPMMPMMNLIPQPIPNFRGAGHIPPLFPFYP